jgi:proline iminopeptidase
MSIAGLSRSSKAQEADFRYPLLSERANGHVQVDDDPPHRLYWEEYGRADGEPVIVLHGGPGAGCEPALQRFFDPQRYRVVLFDQRGCGKSTPTVASAGPAVGLKHNTTADLVADIVKLRAARRIVGQAHIFGGSWGSTLAMAYAIAHPDQVASLVLRGIFLGRREDLLYMYQGNARAWAESPFAITEPGAYISYPDEWAAFVAVIPPAQRDDMMAAYKAMFDLEPATPELRALQQQAALAWSVWEGVICNLVPEMTDVGKFGEQDFAISFAQIEAHYFAHDLFMPPDHILANAGALARLPVYMVHGRYDQVCPLSQAEALAAALAAAGGPPRRYVKTAAGHASMERETYLALTAIMDEMPA